MPAQHCHSEQHTRDDGVYQNCPGCRQPLARPGNDRELLKLSTGAEAYPNPLPSVVKLNRSGRSWRNTFRLKGLGHFWCGTRLNLESHSLVYSPWPKRGALQSDLEGDDAGMKSYPRFIVTLELHYVGALT